MPRLPLDQIRTDGGTQSRASLDDEHVRALADDIEAGSELPPVVAFYDGRDHWLADGFHRVRAYYEAGRSEVPADVRQGTVRDAVLFSVGANAQHGLRRSNADKRRAVEVLLRDEEWRRWSDRKIAEACGVGYSLVSDVRAQLPESGSPTAGPELRTGSDGVTRVVPRRPEQPRPPEPGPEAPEDFDDDPPESGHRVAEPAPEVRAPAPTIRGPGAMSAVDVAVACIRGLTEQERAEVFVRLGLVAVDDMARIQQQRDADDEYHSWRQREAGIKETFGASRPQRKIDFVLAGGEVALALLGIDYAATPARLAGAYKAAALVAHPDRGGDALVMATLNRAHSVLRAYLEAA